MQADPLQRDAMGQTAITIAEQHKHFECYKILNSCVSTLDGVRKMNEKKDESRTRVNYMYTSAI